jgi:hypothetical protein
MRKTLLGAAAAFAVAAMAFTGTAKADCFWTGFGWSCTPSVSYYAPYAYYPTYYYATPYSPADWGAGYKPSWLSSYPGPRPSSGAGN